MLKLVFNSVDRRHFSLRLSLRALISYSTARKSSEEKPAHFPFMVEEYLEDTLGFSFEEAVAASKKLTRLQSPENSNSVINLFRQLGLSESQIKSIISLNTRVLSKSDKTLAPKIRVFQDLGFSGSELGRMLVSNSGVLTRSLESHINPIVKILRSILGSDENVVKVIKRSRFLITSNVPKKILPNLSLLKSYGHIEGIISITIEASKTRESVKADKELINTYERLAVLDGNLIYALAIVARHKVTIARKRTMIPPRDDVCG